MKLKQIKVTTLIILFFSASLGHGRAMILHQNNYNDRPRATMRISEYLCMLCKKNDTELVKNLLGNYSINMDQDITNYASDHWLCLHSAYMHSNIEMVKFLIDHPNIGPNIVDREGFTCLHWACIHGIRDWPYHIDYSKSIVRLFLDHSNIDVNIQNEDGNTALHLACWHDLEDIVKLLLAHPNTDPNIQNNEGRTPLHAACRNNNAKAVKVLVNHPHTNLNIQDNNGDTALHLVCNWVESWRYIEAEIISLLFANDSVDPNIKNNDGYYPLDLARMNGYTQAVNFLLNFPNTNHFLQVLATIFPHVVL